MAQPEPSNQTRQGSVERRRALTRNHAPDLARAGRRRQRPQGAIRRTAGNGNGRHETPGRPAELLKRRRTEARRKKRAKRRAPTGVERNQGQPRRRPGRAQAPPKTARAARRPRQRHRDTPKSKAGRREARPGAEGGQGETAGGPTREGQGEGREKSQ